MFYGAQGSRCLSVSHIHRLAVIRVARLSRLTFGLCSQGAISIKENEHA
jgi:hypothetical protein